MTADALISGVLGEAYGQNRVVMVGKSKGWNGDPVAQGIAKMVHPNRDGHKILISPQGRWQHVDDDGEEVGSGDDATELLKHLSEGTLTEGREDFRYRFNTELNPEDEKKFRKWIQTAPMYLRRNHSFDYDLRGAWKAGVLKPGKRLPEKFKKPNHPTFSTESRYHSRYHFAGGNWQKINDLQYGFIPSEHNLRMYNKKELLAYFKANEPNNLLVLR